MSYVICHTSPYRFRNLLNVQTPRRSVNDVFVDASFLVDFVGVAVLFHTAVLERVDVVGVDDLRDAVGDDDDGTVLLDGVDVGLLG